MMIEKLLLEDLEGKIITLFGQTKNFSLDEMQELLSLDKITMTKELSPDTALLIRGRLLNPILEEEIDAIEKVGKIATIDLETFERTLADSIHEDGLFISLKLACDQERIHSYLCNTILTDRVFISLLPLFNWQQESLFENDYNRDVCASITRRFYENVSRNHNVEYSPVGIFQTAVSSHNQDLLDALFQLEPIHNAFDKESRDIEHQILQALSRNSATSAETLQSLAQRDDGRLSFYIAGNKNINHMTIDILMRSEDSDVLQEVVQSKLLTHEDRVTLLEKEPKLLNKILVNFALDRFSFDHFMNHIEHYGKLGLNHYLTPEMIEELLKLNCLEIDQNLARNDLLDTKQLQKLMAKNEITLFVSLASNAKLTPEMVKKLYTMNSDAINLELAQNSISDKEILNALSQISNEDIVKAVAANQATPIDTLYQLHLDMRYAALVKANPSFGEQIWSQLGY